MKRFLIAFVLLASPALGCPMCKDSTVDTGGKPAVASAGLDFNKSIFIMLGGFAGVVGLTGRVMYKATRKEPGAE
jgi:hypothetical protein